MKPVGNVIFCVGNDTQTSYYTDDFASEQCRPIWPRFRPPPAIGGTDSSLTNTTRPAVPVPTVHPDRTLSTVGESQRSHHDRLRLWYGHGYPQRLSGTAVEERYGAADGRQIAGRSHGDPPASRHSGRSLSRATADERRDNVARLAGLRR